MSGLIDIKDVYYAYKTQPEVTQAISGISLSVSKGEYVAILGRNGSGKSTLARMLNALIIPDSGTILVLEMDTKDKANELKIRKNVGMIFQDPDNQIVGTRVQEDVAFGPENLGYEREKIIRRVDEALAHIGISDLRERSISTLSGGQKQKVAIAGVLSMRPSCIILDESTSMLDPKGQAELLAVVEKLNKEENISIINITHNMDEAKYADVVYVLNDGHITLQGIPDEVFADVDKMMDAGLDVPQATRLLYELKKEGADISADAITVDDAAEKIGVLLG
jgi:energy-coupling factor transport system ATP-binding protein